MPDRMQYTRDHICESFKAFDEGAKGWLARHDLKCAMASLTGYKPSRIEVDCIFRDSADGRVDLARFVSYMEGKLALRDPDEHVRTLFKAFDTRRAGFISVTDALKAFAQAAPSVPEGVVCDVFAEVDNDGDGKVSCLDFASMLRQHARR